MKLWALWDERDGRWVLDDGLREPVTFESLRQAEAYAEVLELETKRFYEVREW